MKTCHARKKKLCDPITAYKNILYYTCRHSITRTCVFISLPSLANSRYLANMLHSIPCMTLTYFHHIDVTIFIWLLLINLFFVVINFCVFTIINIFVVIYFAK